MMEFGGFLRIKSHRVILGLVIVVKSRELLAMVWLLGQMWARYHINESSRDT